MNQLKFDLSNNVDIGTADIIQNDITFKKKNSLVFKGLLSNMRVKEGDGVLTTTGKNIKVNGNNILIDNDTYSTDIEAVVVTNETVDSSKDVIQARYTESAGLVILESIDPQHLIIRNKNKSTTISVNAATWVSGYIFEDKIAVVYEQLVSNNYRIYCRFYNLSTLAAIGANTLISGLTNSLSHGNTISGYKTGNLYIIGLDDTDLRKRWIFPITNNGTTTTYVINDTYRHVHGFGLIAENGFVSGEPHPSRYSNASNAALRYFYAYENTGSNESYGQLTTLDNGVIQWQFQSPTANITYTKSSETSTTTLSNGITYYNSRQGVQSESYNTGASRDSNYPRNLNTMTNGTHVASDTQMSTCMIYTTSATPTLRQMNMYGTGNTNFTDEGTYAGHIACYIDYSDPVGTLKESVSNGEQIFPHWRWFFNTASNRGKYWDYGKGWCKFFFGGHAVQYYSDVGPVIYEAPLGIVIFDINNNASLGGSDLLNWEENLRGMPWYESVDIVSVNSNLSLDSDSRKPRFEDDSKAAAAWPSNYKDADGKVLWTAAQFILPRLLGVLGCIFRYHRISEEMLNGNEWNFNHSFTGIGDNSTLLEIPFTKTLNDNLKTIVYNGVQTSLQYNKTLLFTPSSMEDRYCYQKVGTKTYITRWDDSNIQYAVIDESGTIKVTKIADYIYATNIIGKKNVFIENKNGTISFERSFIPYIMNGILGLTNYTTGLLCAPDGITQSNDIYYYGAGYNVNLSEKSASTSFLLPQVVLPCYVDSNQTALFTQYVLNDRHAVITADISDCFYVDEVVDCFYTHSRATTDNTYKESKKVNYAGEVQSYYDATKADTSWWITSGVTIYPIGICSDIKGVNYITSTVDVGNNYASRFYVNNNKTFLVFNSEASIYFGSQIFTIMSGNYYFDGQGIYYLGSQDDYSQNVFTAYALGMQFLANSSSEAYFYAPYDKSIYLYTASNTLQKGWSFADVGNIVDAAYSSAEQALYVLFDDNKLWVKTQTDNCMIDVDGDELYTTSEGCFVHNSNKDTYSIYNPYSYNDYIDLNVETEWIGDVDKLSKFAYCDVVFYCNKTDYKKITLKVLTIDGQTVKETKRILEITPKDWKNQLYRCRITPEELQGTAFKVSVDSSDEVSLHSMTIEVQPTSEIPAAPNSGRK